MRWYAMSHCNGRRSYAEGGATGVAPGALNRGDGGRPGRSQQAYAEGGATRVAPGALSKRMRKEGRRESPRALLIGATGVAPGRSQQAYAEGGATGVAQSLSASVCGRSRPWH